MAQSTRIIIWTEIALGFLYVYLTKVLQIEVTQPWKAVPGNQRE